MGANPLECLSIHAYNGRQYLCQHGSKGDANTQFQRISALFTERSRLESQEIVRIPVLASFPQVHMKNMKFGIWQT
jgi:hypothetical protein